MVASLLSNTSAPSASPTEDDILFKVQSYTREDNCVHTAEYLLRRLGLRPGLIRRRNDNSLYILTENSVLWIGFLQDFMAQG